ncbi:MAG: ergothioneine biosynthesis protein EgtB [Gammaproteobacteria bacterium]|nr:ergothioneine biosynthesis protein EgtB [Gammaproteobacteria bacterium]
MTAAALQPGLLRDRLAEARDRTLELAAPLSDSDVTRQHDPLMSPIVWDLGHIAHFEEVWLLENIDGAGSGAEGLRGIYDAFRHPRATRDRLPLPDRATCLDYLDDVRRAVLRKLEGIDPRADTPLLRGGYVFNMVLQHEYQHNETILQTLQLMDGAPYEGLGMDWGRGGPGETRRGDMVHFPGGDVLVGTDDLSQAYDNERPRTRLRVEPFRIDRHPVDNAAFMDFIAAGGYRTDAHWSEAGLAWRAGERAEAPLFWFRRDGVWWTRTLGREAPVDSALPVCHVSWYEADAFARRAGKRLPTEAEWEVAAGWDPAGERASQYPWGDEPATPSRANLDAVRLGPAPPGSHPANVSPLGCYGMIGDVWEWTSSHFLPYPGFEAFPYPEYSEVFFGDEYRVLRGGSWATRPGAVRNTFRNWDYPQRRQIFSGFRCASDARN